MEYNRLGHSGLLVSELSFGSWVTFDSAGAEGTVRYFIYKRANKREKKRHSQSEIQCHCVREESEDFGVPWLIDHSTSFRLPRSDHGNTRARVSTAVCKKNVGRLPAGLRVGAGRRRDALELNPAQVLK